MSLLTPDIAGKMIHVVIGSRSDAPVAKVVVTRIKEVGRGSRGIGDIPVHVLSCHRNPEQVRIFAREFKGRAIVAIGGKSFQLPAILDSWFRHFRRHAPIWGIPVGKTPGEIEVAVSAMRDLPTPCLVHWVNDSSSDSLQQVAKQVVDFAWRINCPDEELQVSWHARLRTHNERPAEFNISLEEV